MESKIKVVRFPASSNRSLKAWSATDEYLLKKVQDHQNQNPSITIFNDRFGYLSTHLSIHSPLVVTHYKSQEDAINFNLKGNDINPNELIFSTLFDYSPVKSDILVMKVPKSTDLFHLFLQKIHQSAPPPTIVYCGFMTRHFTRQLLEISSLYFDQVEQSLAWKKSRLLILSSPKASIQKKIESVKTIAFKNAFGNKIEFRQYFGVFSGNHIDYATQFLLESLVVEEGVCKILDLACGNGVIAHHIRQQNKSAEIHLMDDALLAIESAKMNLTEGENHFHYAFNLDHFEDHSFDLIVSNPPFHFEYENTIEIALQLFQGAARIVKPEGKFILVANLHLNYKSHLNRLFGTVSTTAKNKKFEVIECRH